MTQPGTDRYDAVIIGAGIGGLVCGCYLAKAGLKVLIAEQHHKPGGYCTSFKRGEFTFDAAAHSFGGLRNGIVGRVFRELDMECRVQIRGVDPTDCVLTETRRHFFWQDVERTIDELRTVFPRGGNIEGLLRLLSRPGQNVFPLMRRWTFQRLLDEYLSDDKLKTILSFPVYGNSGLPPNLISAFFAGKIYQESLLDGGWYVEGPIQSVPDALADRFRELGGQLSLSSRVTKILTKDRKIDGIELYSGERIYSSCVVSNGDARQTMLDMLGAGKLNNEARVTLTKLKPSLSMFILYVGLEKAAATKIQPGLNMWVLLDEDIASVYERAEKGLFPAHGGAFLARLSLDGRTLNAYRNIAYMNESFWANNKGDYLTRMRTDVESCFPELVGQVGFCDAATPLTLSRYTSNYQGAAYGWAGFPSQLALPGMRKPSLFNGLHLAGHWTTHGLGIPGVAYVGYDTAKKIIRTIGKKEELC